MTSSLRPAGRWDWWELPKELLPIVGAAPGVVYRANGVIEVHRTHLPLLRAAGVVTPDDELDPAPAGRYGITYRPWQSRAAAWMAPRRGVLLSVSPRLGKSYAALTAHEPQSGPLAILAPLDVRRVWLDSIARVFSGAQVLQLEGRTPDLDALRTADIVIGHFDILAWQRVSSIAPATLIIDEIHLLANAKSKRSAAVRFFANMARRIIGLSGTPLWNATGGLWPILAAVNPGAWGPKPFEFLQRHCSPTVTEHGFRYGEISNADEWSRRLSEVAFSATWREERPDLIPTQRERLVALADAATIAAIDEAVEAARDARGARGRDDSVIGAIGRYRKRTGLLKVPAAADRALAVDEPSVVWSWHKEVAKAAAARLAAAGRPAFMIHGDLGVADRLAAIEAWRNTCNGVLCATLAVGQVGIDLSHARLAIFAEYDWTPAVMFQAEMRTFSPDRPMLIVHVTFNHPVEQLVLDHVEAKLARGEAALLPAAGEDFSIAENADDDAGLLAEFTALFARRR